MNKYMHQNFIRRPREKFIVREREHYSKNSWKSVPHKMIGKSFYILSVHVFSMIGEKKSL